MVIKYFSKFTNYTVWQHCPSPTCFSHLKRPEHLSEKNNKRCLITVLLTKCSYGVETKTTEQQKYIILCMISTFTYKKLVFKKKSFKVIKRDRKTPVAVWSPVFFSRAFKWHFSFRDSSSLSWSWTGSSWLFFLLWHYLVTSLISGVLLQNASAWNEWKSHVNVEARLSGELDNQMVQSLVWIEPYYWLRFLDKYSRLLFYFLFIILNKIFIAILCLNSVQRHVQNVLS